MTDRNSLIEWFHALAEHPHDALIELASLENIQQLQKHVTQSTPDFPLPTALSASEFAEAVFQLRRNESAWNKETMAAFIVADDLYKAGLVIEAAESLKAFAASCPWVPFKEAALNQATNYK